MHETNFDWTDLSLFLGVVRGGGLSGGAALCRLSPPTLGRRMRGLERAMGETLFERRPRGYVLTPEGEVLLAEAEEVEQSILKIVRRRMGAQPDLPICISAAGWMTMFLAGRMLRLREGAPLIVLMPSERQHDIMRREATIGLRSSRPAEVGLAGRRLADVWHAVYEATDPRGADEWVSEAHPSPISSWIKQHHGTKVVAETSDARTLVDLVRAGVGCSVLPMYLGERDSALQRVGAPIADLSHELWLIVHEDERRRPAVRKVVDAIIHELSELRTLGGKLTGNPAEPCESGIDARIPTDPETGLR